MAGTNELLSPYLKDKLATEPSDSAASRVIRLQYAIDSRESDQLPDERDRHYEATIPIVVGGTPLRGVERLYRRVIVIMLSNACAANCRWCLRVNYGPFLLTDDELRAAAAYCGSDEELREVVISGGDPFMTVQSLETLLATIDEFAPNIRVVRIGTRVPLHSPDRVDEELLRVLGGPWRFRVEVGVHINHAAELFPEVVAAIRRLDDVGVRMYCQSVLLREVNDSVSDLVCLYDELRELGIEPHYLFHAVPIKGMHHHRTSLRKGLELMRRLSNSGEVSGRAKPMYTAMTDIGKVTLYEDVVVHEKRSGLLLLRTGYTLEQRRRWNPGWALPSSACVGADGLLSVWYRDGDD
jgi:lysine 2,3-aminomutase